MAVLSAGSLTSPTTAALSGAVHAGLTHQDYQTWAPIWRKLLHVYEGSGGFLDGTYLVAHPREWLDYDSETPTRPSKKLKTRRRLARYENVASPIIDMKRGVLFRESAFRQVGDEDPSRSQLPPTPLEAWWKNVDGRGTQIDVFWQEAWTAAAVFGHCFIVLDQPQTGGIPLTLADIPTPFVRIYTPLDVVDWLTDDAGSLTAIRLLEAVARQSLASAVDHADYRVRDITTNGWSIFEAPKGRARRGAVREPVASGQWNIGKLPVVVLYAGRRPLVPVLGRSVLHDPELYADLYNLTSEIRELLRNQTFGLMHAQLGPDQSKDQAIAEMSSVKGTENVLFTRGPAGYLQPDTNNVTVYQEERQQLLRTIHRLTRTPWESDSNAAQSADSLEARRADFAAALVDYADELERADYALAELFYRMMQGPESGVTAFESANVQIRWPEDFSAIATETVLADVASAKAIGMGKTFMAEVKKRNIVPKFLPDIPIETAQQIEKELAEMDESTGLDALSKRMSALAGGESDDDTGTEADVEDAEDIEPNE